MSRSFAKPAFSRTVTIDIKQLTSSTQNTFTFQNYLSYFGRWLEKFTELRSNWRSAPPPTAPPSSLSSTYWHVPFFSLQTWRRARTPPCWVVRPGGARAHSPTRLCAFPLPPLPPCCCPLFVSSSSFSLVILTLNIAGCLCSAFEFIMCVALEDWILTASVFCRVKGFLKTDSTWILKFSMLPCSSGW